MLLDIREFGERRRRKGRHFFYGDEQNFVHIYRDNILHLESKERLGNVNVLR